MKLDDFRKIVLEPDLNRARQMATPLRTAKTLAKTSSVESEIPNLKSQTSSSVLKRVAKEKSPDKLLSKGSAAADVKRVSNKNRISPPKQKLESETETLAAQLEKPIAENEPEKAKVNFLTFYLQQPVIWCSNCLSACGYLIHLPSSILHWCKIQLDCLILSSPLFSYFVTLSGLYLASFVSMTYPLFALCRLVLGTLYPAYASYKAVRTKNVREYVSWMLN